MRMSLEMTELPRLLVLLYPQLVAVVEAEIAMEGQGVLVAVVLVESKIHGIMEELELLIRVMMGVIDTLQLIVRLELVVVVLVVKANSLMVALKQEDMVVQVFRVQ